MCLSGGRTGAEPIRVEAWPILRDCHRAPSVCFVAGLVLRGLVLPFGLPEQECAGRPLLRPELPFRPQFISLKAHWPEAGIGGGEAWFLDLTGSRDVFRPISETAKL